MKRYISYSGIRFLIGGATNTVLTYLIYLLLLNIVSYKISYTASFICGIALGYFINAIWVFQARPNTKTAMIYPFIYLLQYLSGMLLLIIFVELLRIDERIAPIFVLIITVPLMYFMTRTLFKPGENNA